MVEEDRVSGEVALFFDRSIGKAVPAALQAVGVPVVAHDAHYPPQRPVPDELWIREQTEKGLVLVTKDKEIRYRESEVAAVRAAGARLLVLTDRKANRLRMLRALMIAWPAILDLVQGTPPGPWIARITAGGALTQVL